jgi:tetratricopeptide (TPR) repeat protein
VITYLTFGWYFTYRGDWPNAMAMYPKCMDIAHHLGNPIGLQMDLACWMGWIWTGRRDQVEQGLKRGFELSKEIGFQRDFETRDTALIAGLSDKFDVAEKHFLKDLERSRTFLNYTPRDEAVALGFYGIVLVRKGELMKAIDVLSQSANIKQDIQDTSYLLETINWLGIASEILEQYSEAEKFYQQNIGEYKWTGRLYFHCAALTGLVRVKHAQGDYAAIPSLLAEAEQLAQQYEYNDHLASLRLTQGHLVWEGKAPSWNNGYDAAMGFYQLALIHALRYNRFLLDEVLSGRPQGTPLRPIILHCLARGEEGRKMLLALRDWWQTGINDIGTPRPDTISPIPEGIPLLEAERLARERETGDGSPQKSVVEQIEAVL